MAIHFFKYYITTFFISTLRYDIDENFRSAEDEGIPDRFLEDFTAISVCMPEAHYGTR